MTFLEANGDLVGAILIATLLILAFRKQAKTLVGGIFQRDSKGRMTLVLTPVPKGKRKRRRRR